MISNMLAKKTEADNGNNTIEDVNAKDVIPMVDTDANHYSKVGWWIVLAGVGGFLLWALFAPLDKGVPVTGTVIVATNKKSVQHLTGGTVSDILVKEGDVVKAGQPLVRMVDVQAKSNAEMTRVQYYVARAAEARLVAERDGKKDIAFSRDLLDSKNDPRVTSSVVLQTQLFNSRRASLQSELSGIDESIAGLSAQVSGLQISLDNQRQQLQFLKEQLDGMRDLAKDGYVARNRLLDLERTYAQVNGGIAENIGNVGRSQREISELKLRRLQRTQDYQKEVRTQLADTQAQAENLHDRLKSLDFDLENVIVRSPVDGTVVGMAVFTRGGVVPAGFKMMDIVPSDDPLIVDGQVPINLIDKVHKDLPVEMIFSTLNQNKTPHVPGIVTQVSADRFLDEHNGTPYYKLQAKVTPEGKKMLTQLSIRAGMSVEVFVKTGERTFMSYLLKPLFDRTKMALTEE